MAMTAQPHHLSMTPSVVAGMASPVDGHDD
jgi:hypothetical protein